MAITAADISGYSRLMGRDEELARVKRIQRELIEPTIAADELEEEIADAA